MANATLPTAPKKVSLTEVYKFFKGDDEDFKLAQFRVQWLMLSDNDKVQIAEGIGNGTLTYVDNTDHYDRRQQDLP